MNLLKELKRSLISSAIIYIMLGIIMLVIPGFVNDFFNVIIGVLTLLFGVSQIGNYASKKSYNGTARFTLLLGILVTGFGVYVLLNPTFIASIIPVVSGIFIIVDAINKIKQASELRMSNYDRWYITLISAVILLVLGTIIIANPFETVTIIIRFLGAVLVVDGIYDLISIMSYSKEVKKVVKTIK